MPHQSSKMKKLISIFLFSIFVSYSCNNSSGGKNDKRELKKILGVVIYPNGDRRVEWVMRQTGKQVQYDTAGKYQGVKDETIIGLIREIKVPKRDSLNRNIILKDSSGKEIQTDSTIYVRWPKDSVIFELSYKTFEELMPVKKQ